MRRPLSALVVSAVATTAVAALPVLTTVAPAQAAVRDQSVSGVASAMWQTDARVEDMVYSPATGYVYASGQFSAARAPGATSGGTARTFLAAFSASTGALVTTFNVTLDAQPEGLALSATGATLYLAGDFTTVDGAAHTGVAAVNAATGALRTGFTADLNASATAIGVGDDGVYVSGRFSSVNGVAKQRLVRLDPATGAVETGFTANLDAPALAIDVAPVDATTDRLLIGGNFTTVNGAAPSGMAALDPLTGGTRTWAANQIEPINSTCTGRVTDIVHNDAVPATVVVAGEGDPGCWEGTYAASADTGALVWDSPCAGATQAVAIIGNLVYKGSHQHDCAFTRGDARGGYVGGVFNRDLVHYHLTAQSLTDGSFQHWTPDTNSSTGANDTQVGPRAMATDGARIFVGGDFTTVNGADQQGLTRFVPGSGATPVRPTAPSVRPTAAGRLTVTWPATYDADSGTLTYTLYRGATAIYRTTVESQPWTRPMMRFDDRVAAGTTSTYYVVASDGTHTSTRSLGAAATSSTFRPASYAATADFLDPVLYYRMDSGTDSSGRGNTMLNTGLSSARPTLATGAVDQGYGRLLTGGAYQTSSAPLTLTNFTQAVWFRTTSTVGGTLMGMSTRQAGSGGTSDRALMLDNNGNVAFQVRQTGTDSSGLTLRVARAQGPTYHDGRWHLAVGTYDGTFIRLYVDGVYQTGIAAPAQNSGVPMYTRVGYVDTTGFRSVLGSTAGNRVWPGTSYLTGWVDDAAVYSRALAASDVRALYAAGVAHPSSAVPGVTTPAPTVPTSCFGRTPTIVSRNGGTVVGTKKADVIVAATNRRTTVSGQGGNDLICGATTAKGGKGDDKIGYQGGPYAALLKGGPGNDTLKGGALGDTLSGGGGKDVMRGRKGNDVLNGGSAADRLFGNAGDDTLSGGSGRDFGNGGPGTDSCRGVETRRSCP